MSTDLEKHKCSTCFSTLENTDDICEQERCSQLKKAESQSDTSSRSSSVGVQTACEPEAVNTTCIGVQTDKEPEADNTSCIGVQTDKEYEADNTTCVGVQTDKEPEADNTTCVGVQTDKEPEADNTSCLGVQSDKEYEADNTTCVGVQTDKEPEADNTTCIGVQTDEEQEADNTLCIGVQTDKEPEADNTTCRGVQTDRNLDADRTTLRSLAIKYTLFFTIIVITTNAISIACVVLVLDKEYLSKLFISESRLKFYHIELTRKAYLERQNDDFYENESVVRIRNNGDTTLYDDIIAAMNPLLFSGLKTGGEQQDIKTIGRIIIINNDRTAGTYALWFPELINGDPMEERRSEQQCDGNKTGDIIGNKKNITLYELLFNGLKNDDRLVGHLSEQRDNEIKSVGRIRNERNITSYNDIIAAMNLQSFLGFESGDQMEERRSEQQCDGKKTGDIIGNKNNITLYELLFNGLKNDDHMGARIRNERIIPFYSDRTAWTYALWFRELKNDDQLEERRSEQLQQYNENKTGYSIRNKRNISAYELLFNFQCSIQFPGFESGDQQEGRRSEQQNGNKSVYYMGRINITNNVRTTGTNVLWFPRLTICEEFSMFQLLADLYINIYYLFLFSIRFMIAIISAVFFAGMALISILYAIVFIVHILISAVA